MKSLLMKRLPGILAAGLVMLAVGAAGITPASAADATSSSLTKAQKKKRAKQLKACKKKRKAKPRRACIRKVKQRYNKLARKQKNARKGKTHRVDVLDPYSYSPNQLTIKRNDSILWDWRYSTGREPHDVTPQSVPAGVNRLDFKSQLRTGPNFTFKRKFTKPGKYSFVCSIHYQMTMDVTVRK